MPTLQPALLPHLANVLRRTNNRDVDGYVGENPGVLYSGIGCFLQPKKKSDLERMDAAERGWYDGDCFIEANQDCCEGDRLVISIVLPGGVSALGTWEVRVVEDLCYLRIQKRLKVQRVSG